MNILLAFPTTLTNILLIIAYAATRDQTKACTVLLINLAATDILGGLVTMPGNFAIFRHIALGKDPCVFAKFLLPVSFCLGGTSLTTVTLIAIERYISVFHPFYHASGLSQTKLATSLVFSWLLPVAVIIPALTGLRSALFNGSIAASLVILIAVNFCCYLRIFCRARKVRLQIQHEADRFGVQSISQTEKRYIAVGGMILVSMLACFTPFATINMLRTVGHEDSAMDHTRCLGWTLIVGNSLFNPLITFMFVPPIRKKIVKLLSFTLITRSSI